MKERDKKYMKIQRTLTNIYSFIGLCFVLYILFNKEYIVATIITIMWGLGVLFFRRFDKNIEKDCT